MNTQKQKGFGVVVIVLLIALVGVIGFVGWRMYDASQQANNQQSNQNGNEQTQEPTTRTSLGIDEYFEPANISFSHPAKWTFNATGLTEKFANQPDLKSVALRMPYDTDNTSPSRYSINFRIDSAWQEPESTIKSLENLAEIQLGNQKLYVLHAHYDPEQVGNIDKLITSGCKDKQCSFKLEGKNLYFEASAGKSKQAPQPMDEAVLPEIVAILKTLKIGK
jgi:hypothetical protein